MLAAPDARADVSAFPLFHSQQGPTSATSSLWLPWPFFEVTRTTDSLTYGLHPLFSWYKNDVTLESDFHIVWPLIRRTFRASTFKADNWKVLYIFPLLYFGSGQRGDLKVVTRYLLPIYYQGRQGLGRHHFILFPFVWYARDARLIWPLFPSRPQTFIALWPLFGDFRGYWNRDRITFVAWPLFVRSRKGRGDDAIYLHSFAWPIFSIYAGKDISGFRLWPLFSYVKRKDQFFRSYWLWPLGHRRTGLTEDGKTTQSMTVFLPFYGNVKRGNAQWKLIFPFYGRIQAGKRTGRGYLLAIYNRMDDDRTGIVEHRLFWFLIRWRKLKSPHPEYESRGEPTDQISDTSMENSPGMSEGDQDTTGTLAKLETTLSSVGSEEDKRTSTETGWAFFPFYGKMSSPEKIRSFMVWPLYTHNWDREHGFVFDRRYFVPFYSSQERRWDDGTISRSRFFFPFFRSSVRRDGSQHRHWLHLWWYDQVDGLDRNYAPLWTFYEKNWNELTGRKEIRVMKALYQYDRRPSGWTRKAFNLLAFSTQSSPEKADTTLLWGLLGYHRRQQERKIQVLWLLRI